MMKPILQLLLILCFSYSCICSMKTGNKSEMDKTQIKNQIQKNETKFSPGTFALNIKIIELTKNKTDLIIKAKVNQSLGSGTGLTQYYSVGQFISFRTKLDIKLIIRQNYSCLFKELPRLGSQKPSLKLLKQLD